MAKKKIGIEAPIEFRVLMFGPRRCGKSSALSAMIDRFEAVSKAADGDITLAADSSTKKLLANKQISLKDIFTEHKEMGERWEIDEAPDYSPHEYTFMLNVRGSGESYKIIFTDIPGEWLMERDKKKNVDNYLKLSQIILIAVDTPHLMEDNGAYSKSFNLMDQVTNFLLSIKNDLTQARMILFVPLKCEKYYHEKRMDEVNKAVKKQYETLLTSLQSSKVKKAAYTVAIIPILTLGGVVFDDFGRNENGFVDRITSAISKSLFKRPKHAYYKLYAKAPFYSPEFCEQPVLYLLNYIFRIVQISDQAKGKRHLGAFGKAIQTIIVIMFWQVIFVEKLWGGINHLKTDTPFLSGIRKIYGYLKTSGDGYELIQDPLGLGGNIG